MNDILRPTDLVAVDILKLLLNGQIMTPRQLARNLDANPQDVRNALVHLKSLHLVDNIHYGEYELSELGKEYLEQLSQSSQDQTSGGKD